MRGERLRFVNTKTFLILLKHEGEHLLSREMSRSVRHAWKSSWKNIQNWRPKTLNGSYEDFNLTVPNHQYNLPTYLDTVKRRVSILREKEIRPLSTMKKFACRSLNQKVCYEKEEQQDWYSCNFVPWNRSSSSLLRPSRNRILVPLGGSLQTFRRTPIYVEWKSRRSNNLNTNRKIIPFVW